MSKTKQTIDLKMKLQNAVTLQRWLGQLPLEGQKSRKRTQFCAILGPATKRVEDHRMELLTKYANKDNDGNAMTYTDENNTEKYDISEENEKKFNDELTAFIAEPLHIVMAEDQVKLFNEIFDLLNKTDFKFNGKLAEEYGEWCSAFEQA